MDRRDGEYHGSEWNYYGSNGPEFWSQNHVACGGQFQTPVDIEENKVEQEESLDAVTFIGYRDRLYGCVAENNGHTVVIKPSGTLPGIKDGGLGAYYKFSQFNFHWGRHSRKGSEHTINNASYPLEMQFVHQNEQEMSRGGPGLAVLAVLVEESLNDNANFLPIVNILQDIIYRDSKIKMSEPVQLQTLFPKELGHYYRYVGSLTTPPCTEGVIWTVYAEPITIGTRQLNTFRALKSSIRGEAPQVPLVDNFRSSQELNGRKIMEAIPYC